MQRTRATSYYQSNVSIKFTPLRNWLDSGFIWICRLRKYAILPYSIHKQWVSFSSSWYFLSFLLWCTSFRKWFDFSRDEKKFEIYFHKTKQSYWIVLLSFFREFHHLCNNSNFPFVFSTNFITANASFRTWNQF